MLLKSVCGKCLNRILLQPSLCGLHFRTFSAQNDTTVSTGQKKRKFRLPTPKGEILFGMFPILLAIQRGERTFHHLYVKDTFKWTLRDDIKAILSLAEEKSISIKYFNHRDLSALSGGRPHQGLCADVSPKSFIECQNDEVQSKRFPDKESSPHLWLFLDSIKDPMNFGAILRSSYYFGVNRIITTKTNSCGLTPVVSKASAGAMEILDVYCAENSLDFIQEKSESGWRVFGTGEIPGRTSMDLSNFALDNDTLLLLGNEGEGLSSHLTSLCHEFVSIPSRLPLHSNFDSLNVSVATGILLHHFLGKKASL